MMLVLAASALAAGGAWLLRAARDGDRRKVLAGWLFIAASLLCFCFAMGAERGAPAMVATLSLVALGIVLASATRRPPKLKARSQDEDASPSRHEGWVRASVRWFSAGPLALIAATTAVVGVAALLGAHSNDGVVLSLAAIIVAWAGFAAWAFSTRRPLRSCAALATIALIGGASVLVGGLS